MIYTGIKDSYKVKYIQAAIEAMKKDEYFIPTLRTERYLNIPIELMQIIKAYFEGKTIEIKEDNQ